MEKQVLLDKLSEFLMVEQAGAQLYRVVAARAPDAALRAKYEEFGKETNRHREVLIQLIKDIGGDPDYVSPMARVAQVRGDEMLCLSLRCDGLSPNEIAAMDIESVVMAETKDHADWTLLAQLVEQIDDDAIRVPLEKAVDEVESEEEEHLTWAKETMALMEMEMVMDGPAPETDRWQQTWTGPHFTPDQHPAPITQKDGLLEGAKLPEWIESTVSRAVAAG